MSFCAEDIIETIYVSELRRNVSLCSTPVHTYIDGFITRRLKTSTCKSPRGHHYLSCCKPCGEKKKAKPSFLFSPSGTALRALVLLGRCLESERSRVACRPSPVRLPQASPTPLFEFDSERQWSAARKMTRHSRSSSPPEFTYIQFSPLFISQLKKN
jgi:hypothetical protein